MKAKNKRLELVFYISAFLLAVGVFLPLTKLPILGEVTYNRVAEIESFLVIGFAILGVVFLQIKKHRFIPIAVAGVWLAMLFQTVRGLLQPKDTSLVGQMTSKATSALVEFGSEFFLNIFEFSWGGFVLLIGLLGFTCTGVVRASKKK
jgi:ABC-type enterochelin transport system permease subunit